LSYTPTEEVKRIVSRRLISSGFYRKFMRFLTATSRAGWRRRLSPTRTAEIPAACSARMSSAERMPLSLMRVQSAGASSRRANVVSISVSKVFKSIIDADAFGFRRYRPLHLFFGVHFDQGRHPRFFNQLNKRT